MKSVFSLIGVGPGDPELITLKGARILAQAKIVAFPQKPGEQSMALEIAKIHLPENAKLLPIPLPMKTRRDPGQLAYDQAAKQIIDYLDKGLSVAYLCEGDPFFYGSAMYLFSRLSQSAQVEVVPGITSLSAAAAAMGRPLAARSEKLKILPAPLGVDILYSELEQAEAAAIIKVGRHFEKVRKILVQTGHAQNAYIIEHASSENQKVIPLLEYTNKTLPYFALILCYKGDEPWGI